jgi:tripartite-type tricarboxylate transporter receptor subunit TctC
MIRDEHQIGWLTSCHLLDAKALVLYEKRRQIMKLSSLWKPIALACCMTAATASAQVESWPTKPIRILVPFNPGTPPDFSSRILAGKLTQRLGQSVFVENKPGANGSLALAELDRQPADGHTVMTLLTPVVVGPALLPNLKKDFAKDYISLGQYDWTYSVLVAAPNLPVKDVSGLIKSLREKPDAYSFASGGHGTPAHLAGELFKLQNKVSAVHIPYNQFTAGIADLTTGRVHFMFLTSTVAVPQIQSGKVKALAVASGEKRLQSLPNVPTMDELGFKTFDVRNWNGFIARNGTPKTITDRFTAALNEVLADPDTQEKLRAMGSDPVARTDQAKFNELIRKDQARLTALVREANIKLD